MAKLMHRNQYAKRNDKSCQIPEHAQHITFRQIVLKTNSSRQAKTGTAMVAVSGLAENAQVLTGAIGTLVDGTAVRFTGAAPARPAVAPASAPASAR